MRTWVTVDLAAIGHNLDLVRERTGGRPVLAVVKADAYGHGAPRVARFLQRRGCERVAVATVEEAIALREAGLRIPVQLLASTPSADYERVLGEDLVFTVGSELEVETLAEGARRAGSRETVHLEIDTGMGRSGCRPEDAHDLIALILSRPELSLEGAMTHFPSADDAEDPEGYDLAFRQVEGFLEVAKEMKRAGVDSPVLHAANSAGVAGVPPSYLSFVRPGGVLYGLSTGPRTAALGARPALQWRATVVQLRSFWPGQTVGYGRSFVVTKPSLIATVAVGYGDGYARAYGGPSQGGSAGRLSSPKSAPSGVPRRHSAAPRQHDRAYSAEAAASAAKDGRDMLASAHHIGEAAVSRSRYLTGGHVLLKGRRCPVVGRISMDTLTIDVTGVGRASVNDEVTLIGRDGDESIRAEDLAARAECSPYEVTCRITKRVPRLYVE